MVDFEADAERRRQDWQFFVKVMTWSTISVAATLILLALIVL